MCLYGGILLLPLALFTNYYAAQSVCFKQKRKKKPPKFCVVGYPTEVSSVTWQAGYNWSSQSRVP